MKRDDFGMRIDQVRELATKYSKPELARMVKMGLIPPQQALMAGMMIDRIAKSAMQPPQTTVADDVFAPPMPQPGIMGAPGAPAPSAGVASLPSNLPSMAGGGIIAFDDGGEVEGYADGDLVSAGDTLRRGLASQGVASVPSDPSLQLPGGFNFRAYDMPKPTDVKTEIGREQEALREAGVDTDLYKRMREEETARKDELKARREEAKGEALLMAGLGLMGARRGQEFQTLSDVGRQAVQQYSGALREIRDTEKDIKKTERELMLAEDRAKRDMSGKALGRVQTKQDKLDDLQIRQTDQYNKAIEEASKFFQEKYKVDKQTATQMAVAEVQSKTSKDVAFIHERGATARAGMGNLPEAQTVLAQLQKKNPSATLEDAYAVIRGGKTAGLVTDKELQDAYEKRLEGLIGKTQREEFLKKYPTWREFAAEQRGQGGAGRSVQQGEPGSGFSEGQESKDTQGRAIVYRNGQWVYK